MKKQYGFFIVLWLIGALASTTASDVRVVINLSEQQAYLLQGHKVIITSPISSGRADWSTPRGSFYVISKDIDHRSRSFGSVVDAAGRVVNSNATPASRVPAGGRFRCAPMPYYMEFSPAVGMHGGYLPGYPASHGCVRMPRDMAARFFRRVQIGTPVNVVGNTSELPTSAAPFLSCLLPSETHISARVLEQRRRWQPHHHQNRDQTRPGPISRAEPATSQIRLFDALALLGQLPVLPISSRLSGGLMYRENMGAQKVPLSGDCYFLIVRCG